MTYSYTQISQYLTCPRRYRYRYLDGWKEKDTRAAMLFGRAFERALGAFFRREDPGAVLFREWSACQNAELHYPNNDTWDRMLRQGIMLLNRFCQDDRDPDPLSPDATCRSSSTGQSPDKRLRGLRRCHRETGWDPVPSRVEDRLRPLSGTARRTTVSRSPAGLLFLDDRHSEVAQIVFVRKRLVEVQYLRTTITDEQRQEFGQLVEDTIRRIESAQFLPHSGIRFPQNPCSSCPYVGLCLGQQELAEVSLIRRPGAEDLGWLDELTY